MGRRGRAGRLVAGALAVIGLFAIVWTGSAASAAIADRSPKPASVKYSIVPPRGHGPASLYEIAAQTLGSGIRFMQIFTLNKGRLKPNGGRLENRQRRVYWAVLPLAVLFVLGFGFIWNEEIFKGTMAITMHPIDD